MNRNRKRSSQGPGKIFYWVLAVILVPPLVFFLFILAAFSDFSIEGRQDPVYEEVWAIRDDAVEALNQGDIDQATELFHAAILHCANGKNGPVKGERAALHVELAELFEDLGDTAHALVHYEGFGEDWNYSEHLADTLRCRLQVHGLDTVYDWIETAQPKGFRSKAYREVMDFLLENGQEQQVISGATRFLAQSSYPDAVTAMLSLELGGVENFGPRGYQSSAKYQALYTLVEAYFRLEDLESAERVTEAAIAYSGTDRVGNPKRSRARNAGKGHGYLARFAYDRGDLDTARGHFDRAMRDHPSADTWPMLAPLLGQDWAQTAGD